MATAASKRKKVEAVREAEGKRTLLEKAIPVAFGFGMLFGCFAVTTLCGMALLLQGAGR